MPTPSPSSGGLKYPHAVNGRGKIVEWSDVPHPCSCCGGPVATYPNEIYGFVCGICDALEKSTRGHGEYWLSFTPDPEIAHVNGDNREVADGDHL